MQPRAHTGDRSSEVLRGLVYVGSAVILLAIAATPARAVSPTVRPAGGLPAPRVESVPSGPPAIPEEYPLLRAR